MRRGKDENKILKDSIDNIDSRDSVLGQPRGYPSSNSEKIELTIWNQATPSTWREICENLYAKYEELHPNIRISYTPYSVDDIHVVVKTAIPAGAGPDIAYTDVGEGYLGMFARSGLAVDLTQAYKEHGWDNIVYPTAKRLVTFNGKRYGIPHSIEIDGVYWNEVILNKIGVQNPTTSYENFIKAADACKAHGILPIGNGNSGSFGGQHIWLIIMHPMVPFEKIQSIETLSGTGRWTDPIFLDVVNKMKEWQTKGYFSPDINGISESAGVLSFYSAKPPMLLWGSWEVPAISANDPEDKIHFGVFPKIKPDIPLQAPGGPGSGWWVSINTKHQAEAIDLIGFLGVSEFAATKWVEMGILPAGDIGTPGAKISPLLEDVIDELGRVGQAGGSGTRGLRLVR